MKMIVFAAIIAALAGCTNTDKTMSQNDIDSIQKNITTEQAMLTKFGPPMSKTIDANGNKKYIWTYVYATDLEGTEEKVLSASISKQGVVNDYRVETWY